MRTNAVGAAGKRHRKDGPPVSSQSIEEAVAE